MIGKFLLVLALLALANAEIPSYIQVCGRRNPKLDECIKNSIDRIKDKFLVGIPELDIPSINPLHLDSVEVANMPNFKASAHDLKIYGFDKFHIDSLHLDLDKMQIDGTITFPKLRIESAYNVDAKIVIPVIGSGSIVLNTENVKSTVRMHYKIVERGGKHYTYFDSIRTKLEVNDYTATFKHDGHMDETLSTAINAALVNSKQELLDNTIPNIEKKISETLLEISNKICKHFIYEELFPDRE